MEERWDDLLADLEAQARSQDDADRRAHDEELARADAASLTLSERLRSLGGADATVTVRGAGPVRGRIGAVGSSWIVVDDGRTVLLRLGAVLTVRSHETVDMQADSRRRQVPAVAARWGLGAVLRRYAQERVDVAVVLVDGEMLRGVVASVGADHLELVETDRADRARHVVPLIAVAAVVSAFDPQRHAY